MEIGKRYLIASVIAAVTFLCQGLEANTKTQEKEFVGLEDPAENAAYQPWGYGKSFSDGPTNLQGWRDWMRKRAFGSSFGSLESPDLQSWKDWMQQKRGFNSQGSFTDIGNLDGNQFQKWRDWWSKRGFGGSGHTFNNRPFEKGLNLNSWYDLAKRSGYFGKDYFDLDNSNQMQTWHDWMKKSVGSNNAFNTGPKPYFTDYDNLRYNNLFKRSDDKRQFNRRQPLSRSFHKYFTDGLQDWRSTFKAVKREKEMDKNEKN